MVALCVIFGVLTSHRRNRRKQQAVMACYADGDGQPYSITTPPITMGIPAQQPGPTEPVQFIPNASDPIVPSTLRNTRDASWFPTTDRSQTHSRAPSRNSPKRGTTPPSAPLITPGSCDDSEFADMASTCPLIPSAASEQRKFIPVDAVTSTPGAAYSGRPIAWDQNAIEKLHFESHSYIEEVSSVSARRHIKCFCLL